MLKKKSLCANFNGHKQVKDKRKNFMILKDV